MKGRVTIKRSGGYDPQLGPKHPANHDPSLEAVARSISDDMQRDFDVATGQHAQLPAITLAIVKIGELTKACRVTMTIPRALDPKSWAIAHRACAELYLSAGRFGHAPIWPEHAPEIERGRQNTCLLVVVRCRDASEADDVMDVVDRVANVVARDPIGRLTHRVVRV